jgi:hypothetical protein
MSRGGSIPVSGIVHLGSGVSGNTGVRFLPRNPVIWDTPSSSYSLYDWHHVAAIYDPAFSRVQIFIDGKPQQLTGPSSYPTPLDNTLDARLGMRQDGSFPLVGKLDEVRIYNRALSSNEVTQLYSLEADVPVIAQQPQSQTVTIGSTVSFSVAATAAHSLSYQWFKDGIALTNSTNTNLSITNVQLSNIGSYSVAASNALAGVMSVNAELRIVGYEFNVEKGLVAYYPLNGNANDALCIAPVGALRNGAFYTNGIYGEPSGAVFFDGIDDFIMVGKDDNIFPNQTLTWSAWFYPEGTNDGVIFWDDDDGGGGDRDISVAGGNNGIGSASCGEFGALMATNMTILLSKWHHVAYTSDTNGQFLYIDGALAASTNTITVNHAGRSSVSFGAGNYHNQVYATCFQGRIGKVRVYSRALSQQEVAFLYALYSQGTVPPLQALAVNLGAGPVLNLTLNVQTGQSHVLQTTTNLAAPIEWQSIITNTADTNGVWSFTDTNTANYPQRFYRVIAP